MRSYPGLVVAALVVLDRPGHRGERTRLRIEVRDQPVFLERARGRVHAAVAVGGLAVIYVFFLMSLNHRSDPVAVEVAALGRNLPPLVDREAYVPEQTVTLRDLLEGEIRQGLLEVRDEAGNIGFDQLREPIKVEGLEPKGQIRGFNPLPATSNGVQSPARR